MANQKNSSDTYKKSVQINSNEELLQSIYTNSPFGIAQLDSSGKFIHINSKFEEISGFSSAFLLGKPLCSILAPFENKFEDAAISFAFVPNQFQEKVLQKKDKKGFKRVRLSVVKETNKSGSLHFYVVTILPLSRPRQKIVTISDKYSWLSATFQNANIGLCVTDSHGNILTVNNWVIDKMHFSSSELKTLNLKDLIYSEDLPLGFENFMKIQTKKVNSYQIELRINKKNQGYFWANTFAFGEKNKDGDIDKVFIIIKDVSENQRLKEQQQKHENFLRLLIDNLPNHVFWKDRNSVFQGCNKAFAKFVGLDSTAQIIGKTDFDLIPDKQIANHYVTYDRKVMESGEPVYNLEETIIGVDGIVRNSLTTKLPIREGNKINGVICFIVDITDVKTVSLEFEKQKNFLTLLLNHLPYHVFWKDRNSIFLGSNKEFALERGFKSVEDLVGKSELDIAKTPEEGMHYMNLDKKVISTGKSIDNIEYSYSDNNGREKWALSNKIPIKENGIVTGILGFCIDITDLKMVSNENKRQTDFLNLLIANMPNQVYWKNTNRQFLGCNKVFADLLELDSPEEIIGKYGKDILSNPYDGEVCKLTDEMVLNTGQPILNYEEHYLKNNREITVLTSKIPLKSSTGEVTGLLGICIDITERKSYESQLEERNFQQRKLNEELTIAKEKAEEVNRLKTEFINNMSHEVRTPLNSILGFAELINENTGKQDINHYISIIKNSGEQLLSVIEDILEVSILETKIASLNTTTFSIHEFLEELYRVFALKWKKKEVDFIIELPDKEVNSNLTTDKFKLRKVLENLLENAHKFTSNGYVKIGYRCVGDEKILFVEDTGIGIAAEHQNHIFERFSQADQAISQNYGGLGLGLAIAKENASLLNAKLTLKSNLGEGTLFLLSFKDNFK